MVRDLNAAGGDPSDERCDVGIVGAGAAGLYLADRMSRHGHSVVVLEAGGRVCSNGDSSGMRPAFPVDVYAGAIEGRAFGFGGTTSRWGGLLVPYSTTDVRDGEPGGREPWQRIVSVVEACTDTVLSHLGCAHDADFTTFPERRLPRVVGALRARGLAVQASEFLAFGRRNFSRLVSEGSSRRGSVRIYVNAVAASWDIEPEPGGEGGVRTVRAVSQSGNRLRVHARHFVLAAGAIESARILLELDQGGGGSILPRGAAIGSHLSDHLSCRIADIAPTSRALAAAMFGPCFARGRMRSWRLLEIHPASRSARWFSHFIFDIDTPAFRLAKEMLLCLQSRRLPSVRASEIVGAFAGLVRFANARYFKSVLHIPADTPVHLQLDIEKAPKAHNAVLLGHEKDRFGRQTSVVRWQVDAVDYENIRDAAHRLLAMWPNRTSGWPDLQPILDNAIGPKPHDAYHPVGTCRLGTDAQAVVDLDLRVRGLRNLWVLSTGVFPSAGTANPTFSMLCLGEDLAMRLSLCLVSLN